MILVKPIFPVSNLSDVQYKFYVSEEYEKQEKKHGKRRKLSVDKSVYMIDEVTYAYNILLFVGNAILKMFGHIHLTLKC
jgi:hypothetical protein